MASKNGIWALILRIVIQVLNYILTKVSGTDGGGGGGAGGVEYRHDEQENPDAKKKVNELIKDKLDNKEQK